MEVYVLYEQGSWDYEITNKVKVFHNFEKALKEFEKLIETSKLDMAEWTKDIEIEEEISQKQKYAYFNIQKSDDFTRFHDTIRIEKMEVK